MTILRKAEYRALKGITLSGKVLDLGGERRSEYHPLFRGKFSVTTVNLAGETHPDIVADLEEPLPIPDASYDAVLLINVLEHIFEYRQLIRESARVLAPGGTLVIVVPFLFPIHPSPHDYHRYSGEALQAALTRSGFREVNITALGTGVSAAQFAMVERLIPFLSVFAPLVVLGDLVVTGLARLLHKKYLPSDYPLAYLVTATKV